MFTLNDQEQFALIILHGIVSASGGAIPSEKTIDDAIAIGALLAKKLEESRQDDEDDEGDADVEPKPKRARKPKSVIEAAEPTTTAEPTTP